MAQYQTADGRWIVGAVEGESDYHGFLGWRDCVIQLTASGATADSVNYLNAFRDYAFAHNALGESIMPPSVNVWISNNGTTTAVQADDISVDGNTFSIGGIKWTGSAWDYSNAGQSSGGGGGSGGGGVLIVNVDDETGTLDKTWQEIADAKYAVLAFEKDGKTDISPLWWFQRDGANYKVAFVQFTPMLSEPLQLEAWMMLFVTNSADGYPVAHEEEANSPHT